MYRSRICLIRLGLMSDNCCASFHIQTESIGGFKIHHHVEEEPEIIFKFHSKSRLQGGALVTVC